MTLPLIHALHQAPAAERRRMINIVKHHSENQQRVAEVIAFVRASGGLAYAAEAMHRYRREAFALLHQLPPSLARTSLEALVNYVVDRKK